ncbi:MAG: NUDIX domain-containing protein [Clostridiales bacterium]|nr:NUDIX domain-containing protein [Clostridiales bacterium]
MKKIIIGEKIVDAKYDFRETCFGICMKDNKFLVVKKNEQYSLIGGGLERGETHEECLKREFIEESGYSIQKITPVITIDCFWLAAGKWPLESLANFYLVDLGEKLCEPTEEGHIVDEIDMKDIESLLPLPYHKKALEIFINNVDTMAYYN